MTSPEFVDYGRIVLAGVGAICLLRCVSDSFRCATETDRKEILLAFVVVGAFFVLQLMFCEFLKGYSGE